MKTKPKEVQARIKINTLLHTTGWRFLAASTGQANTRLESKAKPTLTQVDAFKLLAHVLGRR